MAFWDRISSRGNVIDRRSAGPMILGGGSIGGLLLLLLVNYLIGGNAGDVLGPISGTQVGSQFIDSSDFEGADNYEVFVSTVLGSNNDMWERIFAENNLTYEEPDLVLFRSATQSACGISTSEVGPHYCPSDQAIYIDETFFDELQRRFGAQGGDVAEAYVIAHEVGHHAQKLLGILDQVGSGDNDDSIRAELQADCFAGLWAHSIKDVGVFEPGEIREALDAAAAVGDDRIQSSVTGQINPETWTHGSSEQRMEWFNRGYTTGSVDQCNTF